MLFIFGLGLAEWRHSLFSSLLVLVYLECFYCIQYCGYLFYLHTTT